MKRICCFLISLILILSFSACQRQEDLLFDEFMQQVRENPIPEELREDLIPEATADPFVLPTPEPAMTPVPDDTLSGELVIKEFVWKQQYGSITRFAEEFMQLHPHVTITFDYDMNLFENAALTVAERQMRRESFFTRVKAELASGEADYLIYNISQEMDVSSLSRSGLLEDLLPYWENDPDIREEEYFTNVLKAYQVDGKMPSIPYAFMYDGVYLNRALLEEAGVNTDNIVSVNSDNLLDWYEAVEEQHDNLNLFFTAPGKDTLFSTEKFRYLDLEQKIAAFDSPDFVRFLERSRATHNEDPELDVNKELGHGFGGAMNEQLRYLDTGVVPEAVFVWGRTTEGRVGHIVVAARPALACLETLQRWTLSDLQYPKEYVAGPYPFTSTDGKLGISSQNDFAIPASCQNKELAWEFIKHCLCEREQMTFSHLGTRLNYTEEIPLNKENFAKLMEETAASDTDVMGYYSFEPLDTALLTAKMEETFSLHPVNADLYGLDLRDFLDEYYINELTTAEQCAAKIQGRTEMWLNE